MAERLIFRKPKGWLRLEVEPHKTSSVPGEKVVLGIKSFDENGIPTSAIVGVCVTDDAVLEMVETRLQVPRLPSMAFFEDNVQHLEDAHIYLDPNNPQADISLDLLLGTQGWRKFAFVNPLEFIENMKDKPGVAERLLGIHAGEEPPPLPIISATKEDENSSEASDSEGEVKMRKRRIEERDGKLRKRAVDTKRKRSVAKVDSDSDLKRKVEKNEKKKKK